MAAKAAKKSSSPGRNAPCPCGSGKKYKDCHLQQDAEHRREQMLLRQAQDLLLPKIIEAAQELPDQIPAAFARFWQEKYQVEQMAELDDTEDRGAERFLTWFAFDVRQTDGQTLVARLNATEGFASDEYERRLLEAWQAVRMRAYVVDEIIKKQAIVVHELFAGATYRLADSHAARRLGQGEVIVGHLVPADTPPDADSPTYYLAGAAAQLTADTAEKLLEFAEVHLADLRRTTPEATWDDLIDQRSEALNHFVMALPTEEPDPTIFQQAIDSAMFNLRLTTAGVADLLGRPFGPSQEATGSVEREESDAERKEGDAEHEAGSAEHEAKRENV
ncbi:MAG: SEC-C domain-containing protein [Candidatus Viridilinea halotolerans]|uniref:SEC-C domain-containing protein n=1 Tax=Candidatus Viridilinea halotolerans TaxID=2491704 RepID=A0A426TUH4_9CHLR|nr:MAG: SEC-C domain-containing protein [Candidatus Viridilinea halotolerans]